MRRSCSHPIHLAAIRWTSVNPLLYLYSVGSSRCATYYFSCKQQKSLYLCRKCAYKHIGHAGATPPPYSPPLSVFSLPIISKTECHQPALPPGTVLCAAARSVKDGCRTPCHFTYQPSPMLLLPLSSALRPSGTPSSTAYREAATTQSCDMICSAGARPLSARSPVNRGKCAGR